MPSQIGTLKLGWVFFWLLFNPPPQKGFPKITKHGEQGGEVLYFEKLPYEATERTHVRHDPDNVEPPTSPRETFI